MQCFIGCILVVRAASSIVGPRAQICLTGSIVLSSSIALSSFLWIAENVHIAVPQLKWSPQRGRQAWAQATAGLVHPFIVRPQRILDLPISAQFVGNAQSHDCYVQIISQPAHLPSLSIFLAAAPRP